MYIWLDEAEEDVATMNQHFSFSLTGDCTRTAQYAYNSGVNYYEYEVSRTGYYHVELWGAQGGNLDTTNIGGKGGYTSGYLYMEKDEVYYVYVGSTTTSTAGGYNGGGISGNYKGGGGATDIRYFGKVGNTEQQYIPTNEELVWNSELGLNSRIMVAAGGAGRVSSARIGGDGGGLSGTSGTGSGAGTAHALATGGTQTAGGKGIGNATSTSSGAGSFGQGGNYTSGTGGSGGGGGYYGGGSGGSTTNYISAGAGGSSFISGYTGCVAITAANDRTPKTGQGQANHYSGKVFANGTMTGGTREGNGQAKITYVGQSYCY